MNYDRDNEKFPIMTAHLPITDAGDVWFKFEEEAGYWFLFLGCNILNNTGYPSTIKLYELIIYIYLNHYLQKFCPTTFGKYITILYP